MVAVNRQFGAVTARRRVVMVKGGRVNSGGGSEAKMGGVSRWGVERRGGLSK